MTIPPIPEHDQNNQLVFDAKQSSWIISACVLLLFFVFMIGFFVGKHQALEQFSETLDQESIADKIYSSLYTTYEAKPSSGSVTSETQETTVKQDTEEELEADEDSEATKNNREKKSLYFAILRGFGSKAAAQKYADYLTRLGYAMEIKQNKSSTSKGRTLYWYQVRTKDYDSLSDLEFLVATLKKREYLKDISIMTV